MAEGGHPLRKAPNPHPQMEMESLLNIGYISKMSLPIPVFAQLIVEIWNNESKVYNIVFHADFTSQFR